MYVIITVVVKITLQKIDSACTLIINFMWLFKTDAGGDRKQLMIILMMALTVNTDIIIARAAKKRGCYFTVLHSVTT